MRFDRYAAMAIVVLGVGCATDSRPQSQAREDLGIARFDVEDTAIRTSVIGRDSAGAEVARMDLVHGVFTLTGAFRDEYDTPQVDGRKLDVKFGDQIFNYEVRGYDPYMHMPGHPSSYQRLAAFLADAHVKPILDRWQLGFDGAPADSAEDPYILLEIWGSNGFSCNGQTTCGGAGTCGGGIPTTTAGRISTGSYDMIAQCCPSGSGGYGYDWFATKKCMPNQAASDCGPAGSACRGCGVYASNLACSVETTPNRLASYYDPNPMTGWWASSSTVNGRFTGDSAEIFRPTSTANDCIRFQWDKWDRSYYLDDVLISQAGYQYSACVQISDGYHELLDNTNDIAIFYVSSN